MLDVDKRTVKGGNEIQLQYSVKTVLAVAEC